MRLPLDLASLYGNAHAHIPPLLCGRIVLAASRALKYKTRKYSTKAVDFFLTCVCVCVALDSRTEYQMHERRCGWKERQREREMWAADGGTWQHTRPSCKTPASCCPWRRLVGVGSGRAAACAPIGPCPARAWSCSWSCGWCESGCRSCPSGWIRFLKGRSRNIVSTGVAMLLVGVTIHVKKIKNKKKILKCTTGCRRQCRRLWFLNE